MTRLYVRPGFLVLQEGHRRPTSSHRFEEDAISEALKILRSGDGGEVIVLDHEHKTKEAFGITLASREEDGD